MYFSKIQINNNLVIDFLSFCTGLSCIPKATGTCSFKRYITPITYQIKCQKSTKETGLSDQFFQLITIFVARHLLNTCNCSICAVYSLIDIIPDGSNPSIGRSKSIMGNITTSTITGGCSSNHIHIVRRSKRHDILSIRSFSSKTVVNTYYRHFGFIRSCKIGIHFIE